MLEMVIATLLFSPVLTLRPGHVSMQRGKMPKPDYNLTHKKLVEIAVRYLTNSVGCDAVLAELALVHTASREIPDAVGWKFGSSSILIECKTSRSDFHADRDKIFRKNQKLGVGRHRYYMAPRGVLRPADLQVFEDATGFRPTGWGLLEVDSAHRVHKVHECEHFFQRNEKHEIAMLVGALRRVQVRLDAPLHQFIGPVTDPFHKFPVLHVEDWDDNSVKQEYL